MHRSAFFLIAVVASAIYSAQLSAQSEKINLVAEKETTEIPSHFARIHGLYGVAERCL